MTPISAFFGRVIPHVIGCPEPLAQQAVLDAAIEFCAGSLAVVEELPVAAVLPGVADYALALPSGTQLAQILRVWCGFSLLEAAPSFTTGPSAVTGSPRWYSTRTVNSVLHLHLMPTPDTTTSGGLLVRAATQPTRDATHLAPSLFDRWADAIVNGALSRLHNTPGEPYTNEAKAVMLAQRFKTATSAARIDAMRGRLETSIRITPRSF